jgi:ATP-dependent DNA helicase RecG
LRGTGISKGSYVRVSDGDRRLSTYEVQMMLSSRGQPRDDEQPVQSVGLGHLDSTIVDALVARLRTSRPYAFKDLDRLAVLRRAKVLVSGNGGEDVASLGGLLALGRYPQEHFPQLMITFVHYPTETGGRSTVRFLDNVTLEGPIPVMVRDTLAAVRRNMSRRGFIEGAGRQDVWEYPETALREAVVNALVHRDLSASARGTQVQVEMYPDRLVIRNPGGLFGPATVDDLGEDGISSARNATLIKILEDVPLPGETRTVCENRGSGIRAMLDSLLAAGMSPPEFNDRISSFAIVFPGHTLLSEGERRPARADRRPELLAAFGNEILSRSELETRTGLSDQTVRRWLKILREEGSVEVVGGNPKSAHVRYRRRHQSQPFRPEGRD